MKKNTRIPLMLAVAASAVPVASAAASAATAHTAATHVVRLKNVMIMPSTVSIHRGDKVTWEFLDASISAEHTVTSKAHKGGLRFKGTGAKLSGSYTVKFTKAGTYYYACAIHPNMTGKIVVR
jgi:plastocyanin